MKRKKAGRPPPALAAASPGSAADVRAQSAMSRANDARSAPPAATARLAGRRSSSAALVRARRGLTARRAGAASRASGAERRWRSAPRATVRAAVGARRRRVVSERLGVRAVGEDGSPTGATMLAAAANPPVSLFTRRTKTDPLAWPARQRRRRTSRRATARA